MIPILKPDQPTAMRIPPGRALRLVMLQSMQPQLTDRELSPESFAGLLSALTAPNEEAAPHSSSESWTDKLKDDVATLSYERALQNHAKYRSCEPPSSAAAATSQAQCPPERAAVEAGRCHANPLGQQQERHLQQSKKSASVTIRMSKAEFDQLQQRAIEAKLSVSAYLRSCTFEVEALRSQVKEALNELRHQPAPAEQSEPAGSRWLRLLRRQKSH